MTRTLSAPSHSPRLSPRTFLPASPSPTPLPHRPVSPAARTFRFSLRAMRGLGLALLLGLFTAACGSRTSASAPGLTEDSIAGGGEVAADSLDLWIGRMTMLGFRGMTLEESDHLLRDLREHHTGGVILFDYDVPNREPVRNIESAEQVRRLTRQIREAARPGILIAIDQEGGRVARLKETRGFERGLSAQDVAAAGLDTARAVYARQARQLAELGINVNFAPSVDVNLNPDNPVIGSLGRSFSADPDQVTSFAAVVLDALRAEGVMGVIKHFPGHGSSREDSHHGLTDVTPYWERSELLPFARLTSDGRARAVMSAHVMHRGIDPDAPATLSPAFLDGMLREEMGFDGIVFSDDMQMGAIREEFGLEEAVVRAVQAGVDVLVFGNNSVYEADIVPRVHAILREAVREGRVPAQRLRESARRIERVSAEYSIR